MVRKISCERIIIFFTRNKEDLRAKYLAGDPIRLPSLNTPLYITLTMIVYENIKPISRSASSDMRTFSPDVRM